jgi:hypothetical protein
VGGALLVGPEDVDGAEVGLDVTVGVVEDDGDFVGEDGVVGEAGGVDGADEDEGVGRFDIIKVGGLDMVIDGGGDMIHVGGFDIITFVGTGARVFADVGDADGASETPGAKGGHPGQLGAAVAIGGQPGQLGAAVVIGMRVGAADEGSRITGATVGASKLIDMEFTSQKSWSSAPRLQKMRTVRIVFDSGKLLWHSCEAPLTPCHQRLPMRFLPWCPSLTT